MAVSFPTLSLLPADFDSSTETGAVAERTGDGRLRARRLWDGAKKRYSLHWDLLSTADFITLETFYVDNELNEISYISPVDGIERIMQFDPASTITGKAAKAPDRWIVDVVLLEI